MDSPKYFTLEVQGVSASQEDLITHHLFEAGAAGVQENLEFVQKDRGYQPEVVEADIKTLTVYFECPPAPDAVETLMAEFPSLRVRVQEHDSVDWLSLWKEQWKPFELVAGVWIVPDWHRESFKPAEGQCIFIEPGMAFGTGTHATTQLASQLLISLLTQKQVKALLDVGTGSGILIWLAALKGVVKLFAYDNDGESKRVFLENQEKNPGADVTWVENWSSELSGTVDLTMANIIDGVLLDLKSEFQKMQSRFYIFTGILVEREAAFLEEMQQDWPLVQLQRVEKDEWVGFLFEAPS